MDLGKVDPEKVDLEKVDLEKVPKNPVVDIILIFWIVKIIVWKGVNFQKILFLIHSDQLKTMLWMYLIINKK